MSHIAIPHGFGGGGFDAAGPYAFSRGLPAESGHANEAHVIANDLRRCHLSNGNGSRVDGGIDIKVAAEVPDQWDQHEAGQNASGAKDQGTAQAHHVAKTTDEADGRSEEHT